MKIAISARSASLESNFDTRFGRAPLFVIYDTDSKEVSSCNNTQNLQAAQGAGIQTAQNVANAGAQAVVDIAAQKPLPCSLQPELRCIKPNGNSSGRFVSLSRGDSSP